jgi:hypothetical protein
MERKMKKMAVLFMLIAVFMSVSCGSSSNQSSASAGQTLLNLARQKELAGAYLSAARLYAQAQPVLRAEGNAELGRECGQGVKRMSAITMSFSSTEQDIRETIRQRFTGVTEEQVRYLLSRVAYLDIEGARYYFEDYFDTIIHLDLSLMRQLPDVMAGNRKGYDALEPFVSQPGPTSGSPYRNPKTFQAVSKYNIPVNALPGTGLLKIWQPAPINTDCQTEVSLVSATPTTYIKNPPNFNGSLGDIYLEVPLDGLTGSLRMEFKYQLKHFEQRFTMINPDNVGSYDKDGELYKTFTASKGNIFVSPEIAAKAVEIVGNEANPYKAARKLYDYVVNGTTYSHMPHGALPALNLPESVFVHTHKFGDCAAQSTYFSALCRAVGIPARTTGGYQMFPGMEGTHFWAEFYLPNYDWVPADTSVAQICDYLPELTDAQKKAWKDYFFGSMDPYRFVIQKDVDLPFTPPAPEPTELTAWLQLPAALCDTIDGIPELTIWGHYSITFTAVP